MSSNQTPPARPCVISQDIGDRSNLRLWVRPACYLRLGRGPAGGLVVAGGVADELAQQLASGRIGDPDGGTRTRTEYLVLKEASPWLVARRRRDHQ
jgi:hypothetical protein